MRDELPGVDVLLVEDEDDQAQVVELCLSTLGFTVVRARDGEQALDLLPLVRPRAILLDMVMPRVDGFAFLQAVHKPPADSPRVVASSSFHDFLPVAMRMGAFAMLPKPFALEQLEAVLASVFEGRQPAPPIAERRPSAELPGVPFSGGEAEDLERIERLHCLRVMAVEPDAVLDELVRVTAELIRVPIALVSIITESRQWWKAMHGITGPLAESRGTPRDLSFCSHAVSAQRPLVIRDARSHPIFRDNELVRQGVLNAYAGVPVMIPGIGALGTLCVLDRDARVFSEADLELLGLLAERVAAEIEWRERDRLGERAAGTFRYLTLIDERHGIYNAKALENLAGVAARRALLNDDAFAIAAFQRTHSPPWPAPNRERENAEIIAALRKVAQRGDFLGWLDDRSIAVVLMRSGEDRVRQVLEAVVEHPARDGGNPVVGASLVSRGRVEGQSLLRELRARLSAAAHPDRLTASAPQLFS